MTKTQYYAAQSIDGYLADPAGSLGWLFQFNDTDGLTAHYEAFIADVGAIAMGAATYEFLLGEGMETWPYSDQETWVFTHRELPLFPGARLHLTADPVEDVHARLVDAAGGKNVWLVGGGALVSAFADRGLLDELWLGVAPVILGGGAPVLTSPIPATLPGRLDLQDVTQFGDGFLMLRYSLPATQ
jgi:dihydrofolate reductase